MTQNSSFIHFFIISIFFLSFEALKKYSFHKARIKNAEKIG